MHVDVESVLLSVRVCSPIAVLALDHHVAQKLHTFAVRIASSKPALIPASTCKVEFEARAA